MTERLYTLRIGQTDGRERSVQVRSETDVQAADAAARRERGVVLERIG